MDEQRQIEIDRKRRCYYITEIPNGPNHTYIPAIVVEGEPGYYATDWNWGSDRAIAVQCAQQKNESLGVTEDEAIKIVLSSMFSPKKDPNLLPADHFTKGRG